MIEENQTYEDFQPAAEFVIKDLETMKVVTHPLRLQILEFLLAGPRTVKEISEEIGTTPTKLYYHMNLLEKSGMVRVASTRVVSGIIEKSYGITAYSFRADESLLSGPGGKPENMATMLGGVFERTAGDIRRSIEAGLIDPLNTDRANRSLIAVHNLVALTPEQAQEFFGKVEALIKEMNQVGSQNKGQRAYGLTVAFYPTTLKSPLQGTKENE